MAAPETFQRLMADEHHLPAPAALRALYAAAASSSTGSGLALVAFPLLALALTRSPLLIAGVAATERLAWLVLALPAGALVDRARRRVLALGVHLARAVLLGLLALVVATRHAVLAELYLAAFLVGAGETIAYALTHANLQALAPPEGLARANGRLSAVETATERFLGQAAGGLAYAAARALPFLADALGYLLAAPLLFVATPERQGPPPDRPARREIRDGLCFLGRHRTLRLVSSALGAFALCQAVVMAILVVYARRSLHLGSAGFGLLLATAALGDVGGSLLAARAEARIGAVRLLFLAGAFAGLSYLGLALAGRVLGAGAALCAEGGTTALGYVAAATLRQRLIPPARFGVVNNAIRAVTALAAPLGALLGGAIATLASPQLAFLVAGLLQLCVASSLAAPLDRAAREQAGRPA